jgi:hypothetical protein
MNPIVRNTPAELDALLTQPAETTAAPEVDALRSALADLRACSLAWVERSPTAPLLLASPRRLYRFFLHGAMASGAMALAIGLSSAVHRIPSPAKSALEAPMAQADPNAISDDVLLADIQSDLHTSLPESLQPLATTSTK